MGARPLSTAAVAAVFLLLVREQPASAQVDKRAVEAKKACSSNQVQRGIELLADYYAETGDPLAIFNQGRCYQQNGMPKEALNRFREYLRKARNERAADRREAQGYIKELEAELERAASAPPKPPEPAPTPAPAPPPPVTEAPAPIAAPPPVVVAPPAPPPREEGHGLRTAGIVVGVVAVAATAAGVFFSMRVKSLSDQVEQAGHGKPVLSYADANSKLDAGKSAQTLQWVSYGAALAAAATAVTLFVLDGHSSSGEAHALAFTPILHPTTVGGSFQLHF